MDDIKKYVLSNIADDNDDIYMYLTKHTQYVDDVTAIPDQVDGQKIKYRFTTGKNFNIDVYCDAYRDHIYILVSSDEGEIPPENLDEDIEETDLRWLVDKVPVVAKLGRMAYHMSAFDNDRDAQNFCENNDYVSVDPTTGEEWDLEILPVIKDLDDAEYYWYSYVLGHIKPGTVEISREEEITEDTVKRGNYWVNKGKEGTHGKFRTKKAADAQRKAMFAQGYVAEDMEDSDADDDSFDERWEEKFGEPATQVMTVEEFDDMW